MAAIFGGLRLVAEPGGAVGVAALTSGRYDVGGRTAVVVCSGGNVDKSVFEAALAEAP